MTAEAGGKGKVKKTCYKKRIIQGVSLLCVAGGVAVALFVLLRKDNVGRPVPDCTKKSCSYQHAAAVSDGGPCAGIAVDIMAKNGTAADAMIATLICSGTVNPHSIGIGGGFVLTYFVKKDNMAYTLVSRETAPANASENMFEGNSIQSSTGAKAIAVPAEVSGYNALYDRFGGGVPWSELWAPSIKLCKEGHPVNFHLAHAILRHRQEILDEPTLSMFVNKETGDIYKTGEILKLPDLARTMETIQKDRYTLKNGTLATKLIEDIQEMGGIIQKKDLEEYEPLWEDPIIVNLRKGSNKTYRMFSVPPPASGAVLGFILNLLDEFNLTKADFQNDTLLTTHQRIIETFKHAYALRTQLGDQQFVDVKDVLANMTSDIYAAKVRKSIWDNVTHYDATWYGAETIPIADHGTSHHSVLAANGDAGAATGTINTYFGCKRASKQTGVILNDQMDDFSSPGVVNSYGLRPSEANFIVPGKRPLSSMCPSIIVDPEGTVRLTVGAAGGSQITSAVGLISAYNLWGDYSLKKALNHKRIHHQLLPMQIQYEDGFNEEILAGLQAIGHEIKEFPYGEGSVAGALATQGGKIHAVADTRKAGQVAGN